MIYSGFGSVFDRDYLLDNEIVPTDQKLRQNEKNIPNEQSGENRRLT